MKQIHKNSLPHLKGIWLMLVTLFLTSCATISENECRSVEWYNLGYNDGAQGRNSGRIIKYRKECPKFGVVVDNTLYQKGYEEGIKKYCNPINGYNLGRRGRAYRGICTGPSAKEFLEYYEKGYKIFKHEEHMREIDQRLDEITGRLSSISNSLEWRNLSDSTKKDLRRERKHLEKERDRLRIEKLLLSNLLFEFPKGPFY